jgi:hypothetical protein
MKAKIAIVGSRSFKKQSDFKTMNKFILSKIKIEEISQVVSGGAKGADSLGKKFAGLHKLKYKEFLPDWKTYGRSAGMIRNNYIIRNADIVFAFWDGKSKGTKNSIKIAKDTGKDLFLFLFKKTILKGD